MKKQGQAALEFLMTYGWAILAAVIVVGVLWYMIGNPSNLAGDSFQVSAPFSSNAMALSTTGIQIEFRNGLAESANVTSVEITGCGSNTTSMDVSAGSLQAVSVTCSSALTSGDRFNGDVTISYTTSGSSITQKATGTIRGVVP